VKSVANQVYRQIEDVPAAPSVVTIGAFDGVHRGHQYLLSLARQRADEIGARVLVITFEPLPIQLFRPEVFPGRIVTNARRRELLFAYGADVVVEVPFTHQMAQVTAGDFMARLRAVGPVTDVWVGQDFALGHNREGTPDRLADLTAADGTQVHALPRVDHQLQNVSSTAVRHLIMKGCADEASRLLGHHFQVSGEVVHGAQVGRTIGFPTANVAPPDDLVPLQDGIYATLAQIGEDDVRRPAMTYIGTRPAVNTGARMIETHLFDFYGDLYGAILTTTFVRHLRQDSHFPSVEALKEQLVRDEAMARQVLENRRIELGETA
jgi:riboflavin kinase/FMN adenylyltransferase